MSLKEKLTIGVKQLPKEAIKFGREVQEKFTPATWKMEHGDYQYLWKLNTQQAIDEWVSGWGHYALQRAANYQ